MPRSYRDYQLVELHFCDGAPPRCGAALRDKTWEELCKALRACLELIAPDDVTDSAC
jgi:hypothetical protein